MEIPEAVERLLASDATERDRQLRMGLAIGLYAEDVLTLGQAAELAEMHSFAFGQELGRRGIPRHYGKDDVAHDIDYARHQ